MSSGGAQYVGVQSMLWSLSHYQGTHLTFNLILLAVLLFKIIGQNSFSQTCRLSLMSCSTGCDRLACFYAVPFILQWTISFFTHSTDRSLKTSNEPVLLCSAFKIIVAEYWQCIWFSGCSTSYFNLLKKQAKSRMLNIVGPQLQIEILVSLMFDSEFVFRPNKWQTAITTAWSTH